MKKYIIPVVTGIVALIIGVVIGIKMAAHVYESGSNSSDQETAKPVKSDTPSKSAVKNINKTQSNDTWNITLDSTTTEKVKKSDNIHYSATDDFDIKKLVPDEYYMTIVEFTLENKLDKDIDGSRSTGEYTLIDGNSNSYTMSGTTLSSYADVRPDFIQKFPSKSKTKIQFVVLSDKNNFNANNIRISLPDFAKGTSIDDVYQGGTFDFKI